MVSPNDFSQNQIRKVSIEFNTTGTQKTAKEIKEIAKEIKEFPGGSRFAAMEKGLRSLAGVNLTGVIANVKAVKAELVELGKGVDQKAIASLSNLQKSIAILDPTKAEALNKELLQLSESLQSGKWNPAVITQAIAKVQAMTAKGLGEDKVKSFIKELEKMQSVAEGMSGLNKFTRQLREIDPKNPLEINRAFQGLLATLGKVNAIRNIPVVETLKASKDAIKEALNTERFNQLIGNVNNLNDALSGINNTAAKALKTELQGVGDRLNELKPDQIAEINSLLKQTQDIAARALDSLESPIATDEIEQFRQQWDTDFLENFGESLKSTVDEATTQVDRLGDPKLDGFKQELVEVNEAIATAMEEKNTSGLEKSAERLKGLMAEINQVATPVPEPEVAQADTGTDNTNVKAVTEAVDNLNSQVIQEITEYAGELGVELGKAGDKGEELQARLNKLTGELPDLKPGDTEKVSSAYEELTAIASETRKVLEQPLTVEIDPAPIAKLSEEFQRAARGNDGQAIAATLDNLTDSLVGLPTGMVGELSEEIEGLQTKLNAVNPDKPEELNQVYQETLSLIEKTQSALAKPFKPAIDTTELVALDQATEKATNTQRIEGMKEALSQLQGTADKLNGDAANGLKQEITSLQSKLDTLDAGNSPAIAKTFGEINELIDKTRKATNQPIAVEVIADPAPIAKFNQELEKTTNELNLTSLQNNIEGIQSRFEDINVEPISEAVAEFDRLSNSIGKIDTSNTQAVQAAIDETTEAINRLEESIVEFEPELEIQGIDVEEKIEDLYRFKDALEQQISTNELEAVNDTIAKINQSTDQLDGTAIAGYREDLEDLNQTTSELQSEVSVDDPLTEVQIERIKEGTRSAKDLFEAIAKPATVSVETGDMAEVNAELNKLQSELGEGDIALQTLQQRAKEAGTALGQVDADQIPEVIEDYKRLVATIATLAPADTDGIKQGLTDLESVIDRTRETAAKPIPMTVQTVTETINNTKASLIEDDSEVKIKAAIAALKELDAQLGGLNNESAKAVRAEIQGLKEDLSKVDRLNADSITTKLEAVEGLIQRVQAIAENPIAVDVEADTAQVEGLEQKLQELGATRLSGLSEQMEALIKQVEGAGNQELAPLLADLKSLQERISNIKPDNLTEVDQAFTEFRRSAAQIQEVVGKPMENRLFDDFEAELDLSQGEAEIKAMQRTIDDLLKKLIATGDANLDPVIDDLNRMRGGLAAIEPDNLYAVKQAGTDLGRVFDRLQELNIDVDFDDTALEQIAEGLDDVGDRVRDLTDRELADLIAKLGGIEGLDVDESVAAIDELQERILALIEAGEGIDAIQEAIDEIELPGMEKPTEEAVLEDSVEAVEQSSPVVSMTSMAEQENAKKVGKTLEDVAGVKFDRLNDDLSELQQRLKKMGQEDPIFARLADDVADFQASLGRVKNPNDIKEIAKEFTTLKQITQELAAMRQMKLDDVVSNFKIELESIDPSKPEAVQKVFDKLKESLKSLNGIDLDQVNKEVDRLQENFNNGTPADKLRDQVEDFNPKAVITDLPEVERLGADADKVKDVSSDANTARDNAKNVLKDVKGSVSGIGQSISGLFHKAEQLSFKLFLFQMAFQQAQAAAQGFYAFTIGRTEELNQQIISTQASLVATQDVFRDGVKVDGMVESMQALRPAIEKSIKAIRKDSLELVGVTSAELVPLFQILASNASQIANQSAKWADPIKAAEKLTVDFAATLGTLGMPIAQARQEMNSMLQGTIDMNSMIAKQLNISNPMIAQWKQAGTLVDELHKRMASFVEANKMNARSVMGILSNIRDVIEEVLRVAGEPIYEPVVAQLEKVFKWFKANQKNLTNGLMGVYEAVGRIGEMLGKAIGTAAEAIQSINESLEKLSGAGGKAAEKIATTIVEKIADIINLISKLVKASAPLTDTIGSIINFLNKMGVLDIAGQAAGWLLFAKGVTFLGGALFKTIATIAKVSGALTILGNTSGFMTKLMGTQMAGAAGASAGGMKLLGAEATKVGPAITKLGNSIKAFLVNNAPMLVALAGFTAGLMATKWAIDRIEMDGIEFLGIKGINDDMEVYEKNSKFFIERLQKTGAEFEALKKKYTDSKSLGGAAITNTEAAELEKLATQVKGAKLQLEVELEGMKAYRDMISGAGKDTKGIDKLIKDQEDAIAASEAYAESIKAVGKELDSLGGTYELIALKAETAYNQIKIGRFKDRAESEDAAKRLKEATQQQLEAGVITAQEAINRYKAIADANYLEATTRIEAEKLVTQTMQQEGVKQIEVIQRKKAALEESIADGKTSQEKAAIDMAELEIKSAEESLKTLKKRIRERKEYEARENIAIGGQRSQALRDLDKELDQAETQLANARKQKRDAERQQELVKYDQQLTLLKSARSQLIISEVEFYNLSNAVRVEKIDAEIEQLEGKYKLLEVTDKAGQEALLAQVAELESQKFDIIRAAEEKILKERLQRYKIASELLSIQLESIKQSLNSYVLQLERGSKAIAVEMQSIELGNKAIEQRQKLLQSLGELEKSRLELLKTGVDIEMSRAERGLDLVRRLQEERIKGTELERVLRGEVQKSGVNPYQDELQMLKDIQNKQVEGFNMKLSLINQEQQLQQEMLGMDLEKEQSMARQNLLQKEQNVLQENINLLKAEQAEIDAQNNTQIAETEVKIKEAELKALVKKQEQEVESKEAKLSKLIKNKAPEAEIDAARLKVEEAKKPNLEVEAAALEVRKSELQLKGARQAEEGAQMNTEFAGVAVGMAVRAYDMERENYDRQPGFADRRRQILQNQQASKNMQTNDEAERMQSDMVIQQAELITRKQEERGQGGGVNITDGPEGRQNAPSRGGAIPYGGTGIINTAQRPRREFATLPEAPPVAPLPSREGEGRRSGGAEDKPWWIKLDSTPDHPDHQSQNLENRSGGADRLSGIRQDTPTSLPESMGQDGLAGIAGGIVGKLDTLIELLGGVKGNTEKAATTAATTIAPVINNQFTSAEDKDAWAKVKSQVLGVIDQVIPQFD